MSKSWADMTDRERDAEIALAIGWRETPDEPWPWIDELNSVQSVLPSFTTSLDAMRLVEDAIEKRGRWLQYTLQLADLAYSMEDMLGDSTGQIAMWRLIRAGARERAEAAWRVLGAKENA